MYTGKSPSNSRKRAVYGVAALLTMVVFLPLQNHPWAPYLGACVGYTVLVFGLRQVEIGKKVAAEGSGKPLSSLAMTHATFLAIVVAWVWLAMTSRPYLPYFLTMEDTPRPYFGLAFLGILGLLLLEAIEQRWLRADPEPGAPQGEINSSQK